MDVNSNGLENACSDFVKLQAHSQEAYATDQRPIKDTENFNQPLLDIDTFLPHGSHSIFSELYRGRRHHPK